MEHNDKVKAIQFIRPNSEFVLRGDELEWLDSNTALPTESEIQNGWVAYQAKIQSDEIKEKAKREAALAKLASLGLTVDDLSALGL